MPQGGVMTLTLSVSGIGDGRLIPERHAMCAPHGRPAGNISPALSWAHAPAGTRSYVLLVVDHDAAIDRSNVNKLGRTVAEDMPRQDFYHWLLIDIPAEVTGLDEGETGIGVRGRNDFGPKSHSANGYDGPCPPWNDERAHRYEFILHAIDVPSLRLEEGFVFGDLLPLLDAHGLGSASVLGTYSTNRMLVSG